MADLTDDTGRRGVPRDAENVATDAGEAFAGELSPAAGEPSWGPRDALIASDFPALTGLPELASLFPEAPPPQSARSPRALSPEIEALLDRCSERVRDAPPPARRTTEAEPFTVSNDVLAGIDELLAHDADSPFRPRPGSTGGAASGRTRASGRADAASLRPLTAADLDAGPPTVDGSALPRGAATHPGAPSSPRQLARAHRRTLRPGVDGGGTFLRSIPAGDAGAAEANADPGSGALEGDDDEPGTAPGDTEPPAGTATADNLFPWSTRPVPLGTTGRPAAAEPPNTELWAPTLPMAPPTRPGLGGRSAWPAQSLPPTASLPRIADLGSARLGGRTAPPSTSGSLRPSVGPRLSAFAPAARAPHGSPSDQPTRPGPPSVASPPLAASGAEILDAALALARAVSNRQTGALCVEARSTDHDPPTRAAGAPTSRASTTPHDTSAGREPSDAPPTDAASRPRRILLRDGDIVTAASDAADETLVHFLVQRGDLNPDLAHLRTARLPVSGRHAAAALIANGFLGQDDLWPVLRAHAEWIITRTLREGRSFCALERQVPDRLRAEPNVFGGATGAEIFIEAVRRVITPDEARARLGPRAVLGPGPRLALLAESALDPMQVDLVRRADGTTVAEVLELGGEELAPILYALTALGVVAVEQVGPRWQPAPASESGADPLDADAIRNRVAVRLALVHEGDYFALLGLTPNATGYDVRRAYLDLRRSLEPSRLLTPATADLGDALELILEVLEEAFDVLRDPTRRSRYRKALGR